MWKYLASVAALLAAASGPASAQQPAAKPESAEAKAAMERAQRMAENPLRVILQAGKIKRKPEDSAPEPVAEPAVRRTAVRTEAGSAAPARPTPVAAAAVSTVASSSAGTTNTAPVPAQVAPAPTPEPPPAKVMPSSPLAAPAADVPALEVAQPVESAPVTTKAVAPQAIPLVPANVRPTLVTMVEPDIPTRLQNEAGRVNEVLADLTLREDGTVSAVALASPVPRSWQRYITTALEKWRFEPLPNIRVHRVQLVFGE